MPRGGVGWGAMFLAVVSPGGPHLITEAYSTHLLMIPAPSRSDKPASYRTCLAVILMVAFRGGGVCVGNTPGRLRAGAGR